MSDWFTYESKAGLPIYHEGKKIESEDALVEGMEVTFQDGLTGQRSGTVTLLADQWAVDDGSFLFWLVFEEGFWGHRGGVNHRAIRRITP
jgi:hypothetical protein